MSLAYFWVRVSVWWVTLTPPSRLVLVSPAVAAIWWSPAYLAFSWLAKANLAAFSCSLANLFSYLETFFRVGLMNLPFMSLTEIVSSLIWRSRRMTSRCRKNISPSRLYHLSKYCWQIFLRSSTLALSRSALVPHRSAITRRRSSALRSCSFFSSSAAFLRRRVRSFFFRSGVMKPFFLAMVMLVVGTGVCWTELGLDWTPHV